MYMVTCGIMNIQVMSIRMMVNCIILIIVMNVQLLLFY